MTTCSNPLDRLDPTIIELQPQPQPTFPLFLDTTTHGLPGRTTVPAAREDPSTSSEVITAPIMFAHIMIGTR